MLGGKNAENPWISEHIEKKSAKIETSSHILIESPSKPQVLQKKRNSKAKFSTEFKECKDKVEKDSLAIRSENSKKNRVDGLISQEITSKIDKTL